MPQKSSKIMLVSMVCDSLDVNSAKPVVPQKPYWEQQTLNGQVILAGAAYCPHSARAPQFEVQFPPPLIGLQKVGPKLFDDDE